MRPNLHWKPDRASSAGLARQVVEHLKGKIARGEWTAGTKIPPQRALAEALGVNRSTIVAALDELTSLGLLEGNRGGGTRVVNTTWGLLTASAPPKWNEYVASGLYESNLHIVQRINQPPPGLIRLGSGELAPSLLPQEQTRRLFERLAERPVPLGYEEPLGNLHLREKLSEWLRVRGVEASPSSILIVSGAIQALQLISLSLLRKGDAVLTETPSYLNSLQVFQSAGMRLRGLPIVNGGLQAEAVAASQRQLKAALLYTNPTFHNPTGATLDARGREALLRVCERERLPVVEDDVYRELWLDAPPPPPIKSMDRQGTVLYLGSLSKTLSPGLRIGWVVGPEPVVGRLADVKMQTDYGASSLSQWAAAEWIGGGLYDKHVATVRGELRGRREEMLSLLREHLSGLASWTVPEGGFYIWLTLAPDVAVDAGRLFDDALRRGVLLNPGFLYDRGDARSLRLSYAYASTEELDRGVRTLRDLLRGR
ncbi:PLP-dependent aminotransferase family protein [Paenibacillus antri]|uniref:PLP-dependent aminotransferase family protein n=1 Tax=Paenibacillus antri TaxID=2582848 RepID=A0A5R9G5K7_9BACL|nr:PLP-dependent aminotransferase family protein [Paenibacillus antri]TLS49606.1 PLP-dependent aminotransferase family protein [Paenibacillus antri]